MKIANSLSVKNMDRTIQLLLALEVVLLAGLMGKQLAAGLFI